MKNRIQELYIKAMKSKDEVAKSALGSVKAKITEAEKENSNVSLNDSQILKVVATAIKQRKQSYEAFISGGREDLARREQAEMEVIQTLLPPQMTSTEIEAEVRVIVASHPAAVLGNPAALVGKTMGEFNKRHTGKADPSDVMEIIKKVVSNI